MKKLAKMTQKGKKGIKIKDLEKIGKVKLKNYIIALSKIVNRSRHPAMEYQII